MALCETMPAIGQRTPVRNADFALYRRLIEIRDGQFALYAYLPPAASDWAAQAADEAGITDEPTRTAVIEATEIAAALAARSVNALGRSDVPGRSANLATRPDLVAEATWLLAVTKAFTTSPIPATARRHFGARSRPSDTASFCSRRTA
jgi:hypothetical protein